MSMFHTHRTKSNPFDGLRGHFLRLSSWMGLSGSSRKARDCRRWFPLALFPFVALFCHIVMLICHFVGIDLFLILLSTSPAFGRFRPGFHDERGVSGATGGPFPSTAGPERGLQIGARWWPHRRSWPGRWCQHGQRPEHPRGAFPGPGAGGLLLPQADHLSAQLVHPYGLEPISFQNVTFTRPLASKPTDKYPDLDGAHYCRTPHFHPSTEPSICLWPVFVHPHFSTCPVCGTIRCPQNYSK